MAHQGSGAGGARDHDNNHRELQAQHATAADTEELLAAHRELWSHALGYVKSMALKCALDLGIPDTIQRCGGAATVDELLAASELPATSLPYLCRLMRTLTALRIFAVRRDGDDPGDDDNGHADAEATVVSYELTATSRLLLVSGGGGSGGSGFSILPNISAVVQQGAVSPMFAMGEWMKHRRAPEMSLYEMMHFEPVWKSVQANPAARARFYDAMDADTRLVMHVVLGDCPAVFHGVTSLVDVGGGRGMAAAAIVRAFPHIKCTVMDHPHVVAEAPAAGSELGLCFLAGYMFDHIPPADALLLKGILQDWDDAKCIKIMERCKEAVSGKERSGKVIIIDTVIGSRPNNDDEMLRKEAQVLCDLGTMTMSNGAERQEHEWRRIFLAAGFRDYKITQTRGIPSIIEVYP